MKKQPAINKKVLRWVVGGLFLVLGNFPWMAVLQAGGVVGSGTPGSCTQAALTTALTGGGTVTFNCGGAATITITTPLTISQDTIIEGGGKIVLSGGLITRLFHVQAAQASLTLNDIVLDRANSTVSGDGGAILSVGTLVLNRTTIQNSVTTGCGGAIWSNGTMIISNSSFKSNTGVSAGGAICTGAFGTTRLQVTDSSFSNNTTSDPVVGYGGAIHVNGPVAEVTIIDSSFTTNSGRLGGALSVFTGGSATLRTLNPANPVLFLANSAAEDGGAIYNLGALYIYQAEMNGNAVPTNSLAIGYGGGIANLGNLTLQDSLLSANQGRFGGGLFVGSPIGISGVTPQADVQRTSFVLNSAGSLGGGLYTNTGATVTVANSSFSPT